MNKKQIKIKPFQLLKMYERALNNYKDCSNKLLNGNEFIMKCYLDSVIDFLAIEGYEIELVYEHERKFADYNIDD